MNADAHDSVLSDLDARARAAGFARVRVLKHDRLGRVEEVACAHARWTLRSACGGALGPLARALLRRERRALAALAGLHGMPCAARARACGCGAALDGARELLLRPWIEGVALPAADELPLDWFDNLRELVHAMHARGVCHNDLHKEPNLIAGDDGWPWLVDFQLASVHRVGSRAHRTRAADDLRHVEKHRRRYKLAGRPKDELPEHERALPPRSLLAWTWRKSGKRLYNVVTRDVLGTRDGEGRGNGAASRELRRPNEGPWPTWTSARGPRRAMEP